MFDVAELKVMIRKGISPGPVYAGPMRLGLPQYRCAARCWWMPRRSSPIASGPASRNGHRSAHGQHRHAGGIGCGSAGSHRVEKPTNEPLWHACLCAALCGLHEEQAGLCSHRKDGQRGTHWPHFAHARGRGDGDRRGACWRYRCPPLASKSAAAGDTLCAPGHPVVLSGFDTPSR